ncbi:MAG: substrate-binding domain-containing protein [Flavobacterium sp.]|uniref:PstS family phosphate ABC transporter substrate-binding protein n=1 Tax=Flavobacterium sp. TaxID=239 RepID=UPI0022C5C432|nr:substrate-binding domain-containing protein [Flavobacterium sp.]MCZ8198413.1 substrate-binding domain-containing protein [Flavobacterium sp.]
MKKYFVFTTILALSVITINCNKKNDQETILKGNASVFVDESLRPIIDEQVEIFESRYDGKIQLISKSENEIIQGLVKDTTKIAVLTRQLTNEEQKVFASRKIFPKQTHFATDAIVLISNKKTKDTLISIEEITAFLNGSTSTKIKGLVFDNPNSSSVRYLNDLAGIKASTNKNIYSFKTNEEVIKYVSENNGMIGVVGLNWIEQSNAALENITVLSVKNSKSNSYIYPSQNNLAEKTYPLARDLYIINCQGYSGLGMGFSSFVAGEVGQRIILKSGLLPFKMPGRNIIVRNKIEKDNK